MKTKHLSLCFLFFLGAFILTGDILAKEGSYDYDILLKNGDLFDGSLKPAYRADVAVKGGKIVKVASSIQGTAARVIDGTGLHITPGFIDLHSHVDENMYFFENRACLNNLTQGVTSVIAGQCGFSAWPFFEKAEDQIKRWSEEGIGLNVAMFVGHNTVRHIVMGMEDREPNSEELEKMKALVREAMEQGAYGLSTGLAYLPGTYSKTDEVIELAKVVASYGGTYHSHIRNEQHKLLDAVREAIEISEKSGAPAHLSHFKVMGEPNWGLVKEACSLIEEARARGLKISADQYPYPYPGSPYQRLIPLKTWLGDESRLETKDIEKLLSPLSDSELIDLYSKVTSYFPLSERHRQFLNELSRERVVNFVAQNFMRVHHGPENMRERALFIRRMRNPEEARKIRREVKEYIHSRYAPGVSPVSPECWFVGTCVEKDLEGKSLAEVAAMKGKPVEKVAIELELMGAKCMPFEMNEEDIEYIMKKDYVGTGSDGTAPFYGIGLPHIRSYSAFLYKIKEYALKRKVVSLPHVIRSQSSLPAEIMNFKERGWIKEGYMADIVVLDLNNIKTKASLQNPHHYCEGVMYLLVNGELVIDEGKWNRNLPGQVIKLKKE